MTKPTSSGLEGVLVAETMISDVDGERGRLVIAGADVEDLARTIGYEEAVRRVLVAGGAVPEALAVAPSLGRARASAWELLPRLGDALALPDAMDSLRTSLGHLRPTGDDLTDALAAIGAAP